MNEFKKLWPYLRPYRFSLIIVFTFGVLMSGAYSFTGHMPKGLLDQGLINKDIEFLKKFCFQIVGLMCLYAFLRFIHFYLLKVTIEKVTTQIQKDLQSKYMSLNLGFHSTSDSGGHISKVINDVSNLQQGLVMFADLVREPFLILFCLGSLLNQDWRFTLALLLLLPLIVLLKQIARSVKKYSYSQQESLERFTSELKETLDGLRVIQSFNLENEMRTRMQKVVDVYLHARKKIISRQEGAGPVTDILGAFILGASALYFGIQIKEGQSTPGEFFSVATFLGLINTPIKKVQDAYVRVQPTLASIDRIWKVFENNQVVLQPETPKSFPKEWSSIEFKNVSFSYGKNKVLNRVSLKVKKGEIIALVGESGSGKSTMVNLLERFIDPSEGEVCIDNISIKDFDLKELRSNISLVTQDVFLFNDTISRNIQSGNFDKEFISPEKAAELANATAFIDKKPQKIQNTVGDRGGLLSGGEKQRISIARAIYKNAPILILDEATSALDSASELEVQKGLDRLIEGRTTFIVAHRLSTVISADRIIVLKHGNIVEEGTHKSLIEKNGHYKRFYEIQTGH